MNKLSLTALHTLTAIAAAATLGSAQAAEDTYVGIGIGARTKIDIDCAAGAACDRTPSGSGKIFFGKDFDKTWGAEAFAYRLGHATGVINSPTGLQAGNVRAEGLGVVGTARADWDALTFKARLGAAYNHGKTDYTAGGSDTRNSLVPVVGAGVTWNIDKKWGVNLDWDRIDTRFNRNEKAATDLLTVGVGYRF
jgi:hypothetical protein